MSITITEALAEIKTAAKRIAQKREYISQYLGRPDGIRDPLEREGGSVAMIGREEQSIKDLESRIVHLRRSIQRANDQTAVEILGTTYSISDWLVWRRDVAPERRKYLATLRSTLKTIHDNTRRNGFNVLPAGSTAQAPQDVIVNVNEAALAAEAEKLEQALGELDGKLSLKNATVMIIER